MSCKSTIFLTNKNEHCYKDVNESHYVNGKFVGFTIVMEISKSSAELVYENDDDMTIEFTDPESEIYKLILTMKQP